MDMIVKIIIKKPSLISVLLLIALSAMVFSGCGKSGTPPPGATLTLAKKGDLLHSDQTSTTDIATQMYRVTVIGSDGIPLQGVEVSIQGSFTSGDNITLPTSVKTGDFGFFDFPISAPSFSFGTLSTPIATGATALASGGTLTVDTFQYQITATDAATPPGETVPSSIVSATTTTTNSSVTITWHAVSRATGYNVYGDEGTGTIGKLTVTPLAALSVCNALTLVCTFTDQGLVTVPGIAPPLAGTSGQGSNFITGTLTATSGALLTTLTIAQ